ncbi:MAG: metal ABC transporter ATP-binding protein [Eubacterium sp.]
MAVLTCKNLTVGYDGKAVLSDLSFSVNQGDYLCIIGENGSGKSTLMKTILNLKTPLSGEIITDGIKQSEIGYLPQQTVVQRDFPASVWEIVLSGCVGKKGFHPFYSRADKRLALENMKKMEIESLKNRCYRELSGGQQQRVLLARALCAAEKVLLLDEPVTGLDSNATAKMYSLIERLNRQGITIIMISHDVGSVLNYASHILYVGKTVSFSTKEEFVKNQGDFLLSNREGGEENA